MQSLAELNILIKYLSKCQSISIGVKFTLNKFSNCLRSIKNGSKISQVGCTVHYQTLKLLLAHAWQWWAVKLLTVNSLWNYQTFKLLLAHAWQWWAVKLLTVNSLWNYQTFKLLLAHVWQWWAVKLLTVNSFWNYQTFKLLLAHAWQWWGTCWRCSWRSSEPAAVRSLPHPQRKE